MICLERLRFRCLCTPYLPVDFLKIDGGFVKDIAHEPMDYALVKSINDIGHVMGMKTIAEFVENESILNKLKLMGVDFFQGYHVGKPTALSDLLLPQVNVVAQN